MKRERLLNRRVVFKLHGMDPLDATILKQDETGYWIRGGRWPVNSINPIVRCRKAMCATSSSAASSGCAPRGSVPDDSLIRRFCILTSVNLEDISGLQI
jgi:hypothetical protein